MVYGYLPHSSAHLRQLAIGHLYEAFFNIHSPKWNFDGVTRLRFTLHYVFGIGTYQNMKNSSKINFYINFCNISAILHNKI